MLWRQLQIKFEILYNPLYLNLADSQKANLYLSKLQALHKIPRNTGQPAWSDQLSAILTKTTVPESGRIMMHDNLAGLYDHHLNMFIMNRRQEPYLDIVQRASFVLDIADEEFKQEEEYDKKELTSPDPFTQRRLKKTLEEKYNTDFEIILRTDFKKSFLKWIETNLQVGVSAKAGQDLGRSKDQI